MINCVIVEDEMILRKGLALTTNWSGLGCELVGEAADGETALELIRRCKPSLIITDIRMPGLDGLELIKQSRAVCSAEYIIMSGYNDFEYARQALQLGVMDYISKPIDEDEFAAAIRMAVIKLEEREAVAQGRIALSAAASVNEGNNRYVREAMSYINVNFARELTIKDVCKALLISESHLTKLLKKHTGHSFVDYLTKVRVEKACVLLREQHLKIYAVAEKVGYKDQRYFSVLFKKVVGVTPKQFQDYSAEPVTS